MFELDFKKDAFTGHADFDVSINIHYKNTSICWQCTAPIIKWFVSCSMLMPMAQEAGFLFCNCLIILHFEV